MSERPIEGLMDTTLGKIKQMVDANTIIGQPITTADGTTIIPVSKIIYGFASGGSEFDSKKADKQNFGGGAGAGVTIQPIAFLTIYQGNVKILNVADYKDKGDRAISMVPELVDKVIDLFKKDKGEDKPKTEITVNTTTGETTVKDPVL